MTVTRPHLLNQESVILAVATVDEKSSNKKLLVKSNPVVTLILYTVDSCFKKKIFTAYCHRH